jgi:hypothetical protein
MEFSKKIRPSETVFSQEIEGEIVLLDMASENYFGLDAIGSEIWALLQEGNSLQEVNDILLKNYDISPERLKHDLEVFVERLVENGLVSMVE